MVENINKKEEEGVEREYHFPANGQVNVRATSIEEATKKVIELQKKK